MELNGYELGAVASQKGIVLGDLEILQQHPNQDCIKFQRELGPQLIPYVFDTSIIKLSPETRYVLVVEKDAVFKSLSYSETTDRVLVTGKGFPDHSTRSFISRLKNCNKEIPIYCLTDSDIYGLLIYACYKFSIVDNNLTEENLPITYLGVHLLDYQDGYLDITLRDFNMLRNFLIRYLNNSGMNSVKKEAQRGMYLLKKAEMNVVADDNGELVDNANVENYVNKIIQRKYLSQK